MPQPKPKDGETKDEFLQRCMGNKVMNDEYPDEKQRYAVCNSIWAKEKKDMNKQTVAPQIDGTLEKRTFTFAELRVEDGDKPKITGHAAVFNKLSENLGGFRERIAPGAFEKTIEKSDVRALINHDSNLVLGRNKSGTLRLEEDKRGLAIEIDPPDTSYARDLIESLKRGDIDQMSFGFVATKDSWEHVEGKESIRTLLEVELFDVSPVTYPAYPQTDVKVRSLFTEAGLDYDALSGVLMRAKQNIPLTGADYQLLQSSIDILNNYLPGETEGLDSQGAHDDGHVDCLMNLRRRLELVAN